MADKSIAQIIHRCALNTNFLEATINNLANIANKKRFSSSSNKNFCRWAIASRSGQINPQAENRGSRPADALLFCWPKRVSRKSLALRWALILRVYRAVHKLDWMDREFWSSAPRRGPVQFGPRLLRNGAGERQVAAEKPAFVETFTF